MRPSQEDWRSIPLWRGGPNTRTLPTVLLIPQASKAADMAHLCVSQNQALGVCIGFVPDIQVYGTYGRGSSQRNHHANAEEEEEDTATIRVAMMRVASVAETIPLTIPPSSMSLERLPTL